MALVDKMDRKSLQVYGFIIIIFLLVTSTIWYGPYPNILDTIPIK